MELQQRKFVILMDYENVEKGVGENLEKLEDFTWLKKPILDRGIILASFAFLPDRMSMHPPIRTLSSKHRFFCIVCLEGEGEKQVDNVDSRMLQLGYHYIYDVDFTDLVIVGGDFDHNELATKAMDHQKRVLVISASDALSGKLQRRFETIEI